MRGADVIGQTRKGICLHQGHMLIRGRMEHKLHGLIRKQVLEQVVISGTAQHSLDLTTLLQK